MIYFMHLKFEKQLIALLAVIPFFMAAFAVLVILTDIVTIKPMTHNKMEQIGVYETPHDTSHGDHEKAQPAEEH